MNFLFVHNNFPAQYKHIAAKLAANPRHSVAAIGCPTAQPLPNIKLFQYALPPLSLVETHPFARRFDLECRRAEQVLYTASYIARTGFIPDVIVVHSGWGENLPLRAVFKKAHIIVYCEFYYRPYGQDVNFDPEFPPLSQDGITSLAIKNANSLLALVDADVGLSPTYWQRSTYPLEFHSKIEVIHEGIDISVVHPDPDVTVRLPNGKTLHKGDEVVTFVCRNLEPLRGVHIFLRALPKILRDRPKAQVLVVGGNQISYGQSPPAGQTWKDIYLQELHDKIDLGRVHFLGQLAYTDYLKILQVSAVHVYLTYPFVLSWSLMEAMSTECIVVASDVGPVQELIDDSCGILVPFLDSATLANNVIGVLRNPRQFKSLGTVARQRIVDRYDAQSNCIRATEEFMTSL